MSAPARRSPNLETLDTLIGYTREQLRFLVEIAERAQARGAVLSPATLEAIGRARKALGDA